MYARLAVAGSVLALFLFVVPAAYAWPDLPPDKVVLTVPGMAGALTITDPALLSRLKLGAIEDFETGPIATPEVGEGITIQRFFDGGTFDFARLTYYADAAGGPGYLFWDDGPQLTGDHMPYHQRWLRARPEAAATMQQLLARAGVGLDPGSQPVPAATGEGEQLQRDVAGLRTDIDALKQAQGQQRQAISALQQANQALATRVRELEQAQTARTTWATGAAGRRVVGGALLVAVALAGVTGLLFRRRRTPLRT